MPALATYEQAVSPENVAKVSLTGLSLRRFPTSVPAVLPGTGPRFSHERSLLVSQKRNDEAASAPANRLTKYLGLAGLGALASGGAALGDVVNVTVTNGSTHTLTADFNPGFQITFRADFYDTMATSFGSTARFSGANLQFINRTVNSGFAGAVARWASGQTIDSGAGAGAASAAGAYSSYSMTNHGWSAVQTNPRPIMFMNSSSSTLGAYAWQASGDSGFVGIRFVDGVDYYYGWVEIEKLASNADFKIVSWYVSDTANQAVIAGATAPPAVPGVGGLAALACGAAGVRRRRLRVA